MTDTRTNPPIRPRFRFGLRTLFTVVTLFACWLAYQINWIRQRHEFVTRRPPYYPARTEDPNFNPVRAPFPLFLFGEPGYWLVAPMNEREQAVGRKIFPEAIVDYAPPPPLPPPGEPYD